MRRIKKRLSRRVPPPKDSDCDNEIGLVDHSRPVGRGAGTDDASQTAAAAGTSTSVAAVVAGRFSPTTQSVFLADGPVDLEEVHEQVGRQGKPETGKVQSDSPIVKIHEPTPETEHEQIQVDRRKRPHPETVIDILYEHQRGGFLCGIPLFSARALGNLDPSPWANHAQKASPTDISTAQVPDPSWEWAWPEWRIHNDHGCDEEGWRYSFMFSRRFSWHPPSWWNSFVRKRAWIRMRMRKDPDAASNHDTLNFSSHYFSVRPSPDPSRIRRLSRARGSYRGSDTNLVATAGLVIETSKDGRDIDNIKHLMRVLKTSRIDREKIEAVENYLANGDQDLRHLQEEMHQVMSLLVFQGSRRLLLTRLTELLEEAASRLNNDNSMNLEHKCNYLSAAVNYAYEEVRVRRLEYWSDRHEMEVNEQRHRLHLCSLAVQR